MTTIGGLVTFVHVPFSPPPLLILAFQPILFHTAIVTERHYMLFSIEEQSCLTVVCQMTCQRSHMLECIVLTPCFCFASSVCFGSFNNLILSGLTRDWCRFTSRRLPYTSICLSNFLVRSMFAFIPLFVDFVVI